MILKLKGEKRGGHVHARMFMGEREGSLAKCGDVVFRLEEWDELRCSLTSSGTMTVIVEADTSERAHGR